MSWISVITPSDGTDSPAPYAPAAPAPPSPGAKAEPKAEAEAEARRSTMMANLFQEIWSALRDADLNFSYDLMHLWLFKQACSAHRAGDQVLGDPVGTAPALVKDIEEKTFSTYVPWNSRDNRRKHEEVAANLVAKLESTLEPSAEGYAEAIVALAGFKNEELPADPRDIMTRLLALRERCRPFIAPYVARKLAECEFERRLRDGAFQLIEELKRPGPAAQILVRVVSRDPAQPMVQLTAAFGKNSPGLVRVNSDGSVWRKNSDTVWITLEHARRLRAQFERCAPSSAPPNADARREKAFLAALYCLVRRYQSLFGEADVGRIPRGANGDLIRIGAAMHAASPPPVFAYLRERFDVRHECFASPFNRSAHTDSFCSLFPDTDAPFGSRGNFFDFEPAEGSFEAGPPYDEDVMRRCAEHILGLLARATGPMSFFVVVPDWRRPLQRAQELLESSESLRLSVRIPGGAHAFVVGDQHLERRARTWVVPFDTMVYVVQNEAGAAKWPAGATTAQELLALYTSAP